MITARFQTENPEQILDSILLTLEAYHDRQLAKLSEIRAGFQELSRDRLMAAWMRLHAECPDLATAKKLMTQNIMAQLDGGDGPLF